MLAFDCVVWSHSLLSHCKSHKDRFIERGLSSNFFDYAVLMRNSPLYITLLLPCYFPNQARNFLVFGLYGTGFYSLTKIGWWQTEEISYRMIIQILCNYLKQYLKFMA